MAHINDLNSPFKLEHFEYIHIGWNQFFNLSPKAKKNSRHCWRPLAVPYGHRLVWVGGLEGGGGGKAPPMARPHCEAG